MVDNTSLISNCWWLCEAHMRVLQQMDADEEAKQSALDELTDMQDLLLCRLAQEDGISVSRLQACLRIWAADRGLYNAANTESSRADKMLMGILSQIDATNLPKQSGAAALQSLV